MRIPEIWRFNVVADWRKLKVGIRNGHSEIQKSQCSGDYKKIWKFETPTHSKCEVIMSKMESRSHNKK